MANRQSNSCAMLTPHNLSPAMSPLHSKLAKLLRLSTSSNVHEAANAARMLDRLCAEHGLDPANIESDADDPSLAAMCYQLGDTFARLDYPQAILLNAVCKYYGGEMVVTTCGHRERYFRVFCTEGVKVRIEVYYEYLSEVMDKLADEEKRANPHSPRSFRLNFRKAFADELSVRLAGMVRAEGPGLVRVGAVQELVRKTCKRLTNSTTRMGTGASAGREAAGRVGLSEQVKGQGRLALAGKW
jgi:hypothetical protein